MFWYGLRVNKDFEQIKFDLFIVEINRAASESFEYTSQVIFYATFMSFLEFESFGSQWKKTAEQDFLENIFF